MQYYLIFIGFVSIFVNESSGCDVSSDCYSGGTCVNFECVCPDGWSGNLCQNCVGRFVVNNTSGTITDGNHDNHQHSNNCLWVIQQPDSMPDSVLRLEYTDVSAVCKSNVFQVFDGSSVYNPMLANFNGIVDPGYNKTSETSSGSAVIQFNHVSSNHHVEIKYEFTVIEHQANQTANFTCVEQWCQYTWLHLSEFGRASTSIAMVMNQLFIYSGFLFGFPKSNYEFYYINLDDMTVHEVSAASASPPSRFGHTMVRWQDSLLVYGGIQTETYSAQGDLWKYNITNEAWEEMSSQDGPVLTGHTAHMVKHDGVNVMLVIFGYSPQWGYSNLLFEYDLSNGTWTQLSTSGATPVARYGHASTKHNNDVYVYGGYYEVSSKIDIIYKYDVDMQRWEAVHSVNDPPRYLHSMSASSGVLHIVGGKYIDLQTACEQTSEYLYFIEHNVGYLVDYSFEQRYGHSTVSNDNSTVMVGGFDSTMISDLYISNNITTHPNSSNIPDANVNCSSITNETRCLELVNFCSWNETCEQRDCPLIHESQCSEICTALSSCYDCETVNTTCCSCVFDGVCRVNENNQFPQNESACGNRTEEACKRITTCGLCNEVEGCAWNNRKCVFGGNTTECDTVCSSLDTCHNCTSDNSCYWCETTSTCIAQNSVNVYYPYGSCTQWGEEGQCGVDICSGYTSCDDCLGNTFCGWCNFNGTGQGQCLSGSIDGPLSNDTCLVGGWDYTDCKGCQCNGHSNTCTQDIYNCTDCQDYTEGEQCDDCEAGYYGKPLNGETCNACECNDHAIDCATNGNCFCDVQGMTGNNCETCQTPQYNGEPAAVNGSCFYSILLQIRYLFSLADSTYKNKINFDICPKRDKDLRLTIAADVTREQYGRFDAIISTNFSDTNSSEVFYLQYTNESKIVVVFKQEDFQFGQDPLRCIRIYLGYDPPFYFSIALQQDYMNVAILIATFFICFFSLMIIAGIFYKGHSMIMRRRQRMRRQVELEEMAARPFASINFDVSDYKKPVSALDNPSSVEVSNEICEDGHGMVVTVMLWMPSDSPAHSVYFGSTLLKNSSNIVIHRSGGQDSSNCSPLQRVTSYLRSIVYSNPSSNTQEGIDNPVLDLQMDNVRDIPSSSSNVSA